jgi:hypothetical protein
MLAVTASNRLHLRIQEENHDVVTDEMMDTPEAEASKTTEMGSLNPSRIRFYLRELELYQQGPKQSPRLVSALL